jgi:ribosomal protein L40E
MATGNFRTMADFPLIVKGEEYIKVCPECYLSNSSEAEKCECGCDLSEVEAIVDEFACEYTMKEMEKVAAELNEVQSFYTVSVESGYYAGVQFYVDAKYCDIEDMSNEESRDEFGMCRSEMLRRFKVAGNTIRRRLYKAKDELGLDELICTARFSNGEAWYQRVDTRKPLPVKVAAKAAIAAA